MYIDGNTIIQLSALLGALGVLMGVLIKGLNFVNAQKQQEKEIAQIKAEQSLLTYGVLGALKGLAEMGCDGPVKEAIVKIEKHIHEKAHE